MATSLYAKRFPLNQSIEWTFVCNIDRMHRGTGGDGDDGDHDHDHDALS